ncbi:MAG: hypothetical protein SCH98_04570 [Deferrisomatales bacterium]|nr:hypothetical protein [Deferrisomatales bacterium]
MSSQTPLPPGGGGLGPLGGRGLGWWVHLAFWTALFYLLTVAAAKLAEWLSEL